MIQRIQTVYMFLAVLMLIICACIPIGAYYPNGMGAAKELYNIAIIDNASGSWDFTAAGLVVLLAVPAVFTVQNIFQYNNRKAQIRNCMICIILLALWYVLYVAQITLLCPDGYTTEPGFAASIPAISIILLLLARRGIVKDEKLIRSVDRIR